MSGYDRSRIVGESEEVLDEFICGICLAVFIKPTVTQCCGQTYCFDCINEWVHQNNTCPNDRKILTTNRLKRSPKMVTNLLNNMRIKCDFHEKGCKAVVKINDLVKHKESVCAFNPSRYCNSCGDIKLNHSNKKCIKSLVTKLDGIQKENHNLREQKDMDHINYEKLKVDFKRSERMNDLLKKRVHDLQKEHGFPSELTESAAQESNDPKVDRSGASYDETSSGTEENPFEFLRTEPSFKKIRSYIHENPQLLNDVAQQMGQINLNCLSFIVQNQEAFVRMINEPTPSGGQTPIAGAKPATTVPRSSFFWFCNNKRPRISENINDPTVGEVAKDLERRWNECTEEQKSKYLALADTDKARYVKELKAYIAQKGKPPPVPKNEESDDAEEDKGENYDEED